MSLHKEVRIDQVEDETYFNKCMSFFRLKYNAIMKSKAPVCLLVSIYIFICVLGNIVTGIIFFKHRGEDDQSEALNTITDKLHLNDSIPSEALNNTEAGFEYFDYSEDYAAQSEEWNLYLLFSNDSNNEVGIHGMFLVEMNYYYYSFYIYIYIYIGKTIKISQHVGNA